MNLNVEGHSQIAVAQDYHWISWFFDETNGGHHFWCDFNAIKLELGQALEVYGLIVNFVNVGKTALVGQPT